MSQAPPTVPPDHAGTALPGRVGAVDALRFVAAFLVVYAHTDIDWDRGPTWVGPAEWVQLSAGTGVSLFLVLSGFSITASWSARRDRGAFPVRAFWVRRFFRLYPTFWASAVLSSALLVVAYGWPRVRDRDREWLYLLDGQIPVWVQVLGYATVVTANIVPLAHFGRAWSLALEEQLYALYTWTQVRWRGLDPWRLLPWCVVSILVWRVGLLLAVPGFGAISSGSYDPREVFAYFQVPDLALPWVAGWCVARARAGVLVLPRWARSGTVGVAALTVGVLGRAWGGPVLELPGGRLCAPVDLLLPVLFGGGFAIVVAACVLPGAAAVPRGLRAAQRAAVWAGGWSYSLYLLHQPALDVVDERTSLPTAPRVVLGWVAALALSCAFWWLVERRWVERARRVPVTRAG